MSNARIYVACLASYNAGILHGRWIDASDDVADMKADISAMLRESPCPNVERQDYFCDDCGEGASVTLGFDRRANDGQKCEHCGKAMRPLVVYASAEEWAIHDHEGLGESLGEYAGLDEVARRVSLVDLADDKGIPFSVLLQFADDRMSGEWDSDDLESAVDDSYRGTADSWAAFAEEFTREVHDMREVPEWLENHIDWESVGREFSMSGDFVAYDDGGEMHFFWSH